MRTKRDDPCSSERAAVREAELMDELKAVQKAKQTDKQSLLSQMGKVGEEVRVPCLDAAPPPRPPPPSRKALTLADSLCRCARWTRR